jgi:hypothetical protein
MAWVPALPTLIKAGPIEVAPRTLQFQLIPALIHAGPLKPSAAGYGGLGASTSDVDPGRPMETGPAGRRASSILGPALIKCRTH